jgi:putative DNA primase/helicase
MSADDVRAAFAAAREFEPKTPHPNKFSWDGLDTDADESAAWPEMEPLVPPADEPLPYPIDALPSEIGAAVRAYQSYGQQPMALVACSALSALSLAAQGQADVGRDDNLVGPISLNMLTIAESGERKTSADRRMAKAAREWRKAKLEDLRGDAEAASSKVAAHYAQREGVLAKIKSAAGKKGEGGNADIVDLKAQLEDLDRNAPREMILPRLFFEDVTPEKLGEMMAVGWPSASLWSDEGGLVVGGHGMSDDSAMRFFALLNRFWDGRDFDRDRSTTKSFQIDGRRFTVSLMMQQVVFEKLIAAGGGASRGIGFLARFLTASPPSTMGSRFYKPGDLNAPESRAFDQRIQELLSLKLPTEGDNMALRPPVLSLSAAAHEEWRTYHDAVESELRRGGEFGDVGDFAAKNAENAARLAALFHVFAHGPCGEIDADLMKAGCAVAMWHLLEAKRLIGPAKLPQAVADARALEDWLIGRPRPTTRRDISQYGPSPVRDRARRDAALDLLIEKHRVAERQQQSGVILVLHPHIRRGA